jgi:hypothetical protein
MHSSSWLGSCKAPDSYSADARFKPQPSLLSDIFVNFLSPYNQISGGTSIRSLKFPYKSFSIHLSSHHSTLYSVVAQSIVKKPDKIFAFSTCARDGGAAASPTWKEPPPEGRLGGPQSRSGSC